jgi:flagellar biosynthesis protein FlhF
MAEALQKVKKDLGREAVILHTRTVRRGGMLGFGGKTLVEITATRDVNVLHPAERRAIVGRDSGMTRPAAAGAAEATARGSRPVVAQAGTRRLPTPETVSAPAGEKVTEFTSSLRGEVGELREMVRELLTRGAKEEAGAPAVPDLPEELREYYTTLIQNSVADEIAREVVARARDRLAECRAQAGQRVANIALNQLIPAILVESIERMLPPAEPVQLAANGTKYVALVGPTGVGKTTTIAKLAAHFKLRENKRVGMITIDTYRIAAVEQLRAYADILRVPLEIVLTPAEMTAALERMADMDLVLIDTSGRSQRDVNRIGELKSFLDAARQAGGEGSDGALEVHLVLSCTGHPAQLVDVAEKFASLGVRRVVFTKLDEAVGLGVILNVIRKLNLQLSYLTTGQDVPDDIEVGHRRRIAELVLDRPATGPGPTDRLAAPAVDQVA